MADAAVKRAERGISLIEEDEVQIKPEDLLPNVTVILDRTIQDCAKKYFDKDAWNTALSTIWSLEVREQVDDQSKNMTGNVQKIERNNSYVNGEKVTEPQEEDQENVKPTENNLIDKEIEEFLHNYSDRTPKSLPHINNSIFDKFEDGTNTIDDDERDEISQYLCSNYDQLRDVSRKDLPSMLHDTIAYLMTRETLVDKGVNALLRKIASKGSPQMEITVAEGKITITMKTGFFSDVSHFSIDEEFMKEFQGNWMKAQPSYEDGKIIMKLTPIDPKSSMPPQTVQRELVGEEVVITMIIGDVICKRYFKKIS